MSGEGVQPTSAAALAYEAADVGYRGQRIIASASLRLAAGEIVGLVGPNGAGKSTLLRAVTGDAELLGGSITIGGVDSQTMRPLDRARSVGVVPQQVPAAFSLPAREFVAMGRHARMARFAALSARDAEVVERAMLLTDTLRLAEKPADALSGGDVQRLALAQALAQEPTVLLLDEPVSHLDLNHRLQILDLTRNLADGGMAVLAVFHDLDLAARYADRIAVVADGALGVTGTPEHVITTSLLSEVFGVRAVVGTDVVTGAVSVTPVLREQAVAEHPRGRVMVVGGSGVAAPLMRRLVLAGWEVSAGALNLGDADEVVARALRVSYVELPPFEPMQPGSRSAVESLAAEAQAVVVAEVPFGNGNVANLRAVLQSGRPVVLVGDIDGRDYTGGEATALWDRALAAGAVRVDRLDDAQAALEALVPEPRTSRPRP